MKASYRKYNDRTHNSSTYHKKDGTSVRAILKEQLRKIVNTTVTCRKVECATQTAPGNLLLIGAGCGKD